MIGICWSTLCTGRWHDEWHVQLMSKYGHVNHMLISLQLKTTCIKCKQLRPSWWPCASDMTLAQEAMDQYCTMSQLIWYCLELVAVQDSICGLHQWNYYVANTQHFTANDGGLTTTKMCGFCTSPQLASEFPQRCNSHWWSSSHSCTLGAVWTHIWDCVGTCWAVTQQWSWLGQTGRHLDNEGQRVTVH